MRFAVLLLALVAASFAFPASYYCNNGCSNIGTAITFTDGGVCTQLNVCSNTASAVSAYYKSVASTNGNYQISFYNSTDSGCTNVLNAGSVTTNSSNPSACYSVAALGTFSFQQTAAATSAPTSAPTTAPTASPSGSPTTAPSTAPSGSPSGSPTTAPSGSPSGSPTTAPSGSPSGSPTTAPSGSPSGSPTTAPSGSPSGSPTSAPSGSPTSAPSGSPTSAPSGSPTSAPTGTPTTPGATTYIITVTGTIVGQCSAANVTALKNAASPVVVVCTNSTTVANGVTLVGTVTTTLSYAQISATINTLLANYLPGAVITPTPSPAPATAAPTTSTGSSSTTTSSASSVAASVVFVVAAVALAL